MAETATAAAKPNLEKRDAILAAALRLITRFGLHNTPMSAVAREAGVAVGTVYLYFPSKEAMINALYLHVLEDRNRSLYEGADSTPVAPADQRAAFWGAWHALARWHLEHEAGSNLIAQCRASGILSEETRAIEQRMDIQGLARYEQAVAQGTLRGGMSRYVLWALFAGPVYALVQMRDAGETEITEDILRATFDGVCRALLRDQSAP
jgi:TetR/AcrR family transcriptional regulator, repressor of fatR-cypB operon